MSIENYIGTENDPQRLYNGIRERLQELNKRGRYPEDWTIKHLQRLADARYSELTEGAKN